MSKTPDLNVNRSPAELIASQRKPNIQSETGWYRVGEEWAIDEPITVGFTNSWDNAGVVAGVTNAPTGWYLSEDGEVRLRGKITGGLPGTVVFILPEEVRPQYADTFVVPRDGDGNIDLSAIRYRAYEDGDA